jgi:hypothetical protein
MTLSPPAPSPRSPRPYARIQDFHAADTWLVCEAHALNGGRAADPEAKRAEVVRRFEALEAERRRWFTELLDGPSPASSVSCSTPDSTSPPS